MTDPTDPTDPTAANDPGDLAAFGRWLVRERELRGLGRDEVTRATKLAPGVVEALESGEQGRIPPHAYVVGYLRSYAQAVGLDPDEVVLRFEEAAGPARPPPATRRRPAIEAAAPGRAARRGSPEAAAPPARRAPAEAAGPARAAAPAAGSSRRARIAVAVAVGAAAAAAAAWALLGP